MDKYPHYAKSKGDAKGAGDKRSARSNSPREWDDDDNASGNYSRSGPGKSGRSHHTEDGSASRDSRSHSREADGDGGRRAPSGSREVSEERGRKDRAGATRSRDIDRADSREASREKGLREDSREGSVGSRREQREDHRLAARNEMPSTEATASARMHGHINRYDADEKVCASGRLFRRLRAWDA